MKTQEQATQTKQDLDHQHDCYKLISRNLLQLLSSLLLPLILGVFTVVITFEQQRIAREQWLADKNESRLQREHEMKIAYEEQETQRQVNQDQYREQLLAGYIKEMGDLLKDNNGSLTSNALTHLLARAKTLNAIGQLDGLRQARIIRFLYEAKQLQCACISLSQTLDISTAEFNKTNFDKLSNILVDGGLSLASVYLQNSTLEDLQLNFVNFSSARIKNVNFASAKLSSVNFSLAHLENINFSSANLFNIDFWSSGFINIDFSNTNVYCVKFSPIWFDNAIHLPAWLFNVNFSSAKLHYANFTSVSLLNASFSSASLYNVTFSFAGINDATFLSTNLFNVSFSSAALVNVRFTSVIFNNFNTTSNFYRTKFFSTEFIDCDCRMTNFANAYFQYSSFHNTLLQGANFTNSYLQYTNFINTNITDEQLHSALFIREVKLANGTVLKGKNLIQNGDANCRISLADHWHVQYGKIEIMSSENNRDDCRFTLKSNTTTAVMLQRINLTQIHSQSLWPRSSLRLQSCMTDGVSIELSAMDNHGFIIDTINSLENHMSMQLQANMKQIQITVKFDSHASSNQSKAVWCDDIELFTDYDR